MSLCMLLRRCIICFSSFMPTYRLVPDVCLSYERKQSGSFFESLCTSLSVYWCHMKWRSAGFRKTRLLIKSPTHWVFGLYWVLGFIGFSDFLFERVVGKLVGWFSLSANLLFRYTRTLDYLKICKFIAYRLLEAVNIKISLIITGTTNWNWIKFGELWTYVWTFHIPDNLLGQVCSSFLLSAIRFTIFVSAYRYIAVTTLAIIAVFLVYLRQFLIDLHQTYRHTSVP